jgi:hypothetical protein
MLDMRRTLMVWTVLTGILLIAILAKICPITWNAAIGQVCAKIARVGLFNLDPENPDVSSPSDIERECADDLELLRPPELPPLVLAITLEASHFHDCAIPSILAPSVNSQQYPATKKN